jgi:hypothetical protein
MQVGGAASASLTLGKKAADAMSVPTKLTSARLWIDPKAVIVFMIFPPSD